MDSLLACVPVLHLCAWYPWKPEEVMGYPGARVTDEPLCRCWRSTLDPIEEKPGFLTAEASLQSPGNILFYKYE